MRFIAEHGAFRDALSFVAKYAAKDSIPILQTVRVEAVSGEVILTCTDLDRAAQCVVPAEIEAEGSACLPANLVAKAIKSCAGDVNFTADARDAKVRVGKSLLSFPILPAGDFPPLPMLTSEGAAVLSIDGGRLSKWPRQVTFAREQDGGRWYLAGTSWREIDGKLEICATDGKRIAIISSDIPAPGMPSVIVPDFDLPSWKDVVNVAVSDAFVRFSSGDQTVASKVVDGSFPDYRRVLPEKLRSKIVISREDLEKALKRSHLIEEGKEHRVIWVGRDGVLSILTSTSRGEFADEVAFEGPDFQICFLRNNIASVIDSFECDSLEICIEDHRSGVTVHDPADASRIALAQPYMDPRLLQYITPEAS